MPPPKADKPASSGSAIGRFFSLLLAGLVGGFLALLGADTLKPQIAKFAPQLGLPSDAVQSNAAMDDLKARLAKLEKTQTGGEGGASLTSVAEQVAAANAKIAELEGLSAKVATLAETQGTLAETTAALSERVATQPTGTTGEGAAVNTDRLAKLEQQFNTLTSAAGSNPNAETLPQLAAITGRFADLESSVGAQLDALRQSVGQDLDTRVTSIAETSEQAKAAAQRIDRQIATVTTDAARNGQRMEALKADGDRITETLRVVQEETGQLRSTLDALKGDLEARLGKVALPADISKAIQPVTEKLTSLETSVAGVVSAEADRKTNAQRIVLSLELANLKRAIDRGEDFSGELSAVSSTASGVLDLKALEQYQSAGVSTLGELEQSFKPVIGKVLEAAERPADGSVFDQLLAGAKSVVRVRSVNHDAGDKSAEAVVARMEKALSAGQLETVLEQGKLLDGAAATAAGDWLGKVEARHAVDVALAQVEQQLKTSLSGGQG
ncbi:MAG: hypothetical protein AAFR75_06785 [Pseudomonadota bacterium]